MNAPNGEPNELELQIVELQKEKTVLERVSRLIPLAYSEI